MIRSRDSCLWVDPRMTPGVRLDKRPSFGGPGERNWLKISLSIRKPPGRGSGR